MPENNLNPAEQASQQCLEQVYQALAESQHFLVEAGAGAGKTYTLIKALRKLIETDGHAYQRANRKIACITYTNIAKNEIRSRTDHHPVIFAETIHAFAWELIQGFQTAIRARIPDLSERWQERIAESEGVTDQKVKYNLGYPKITDEEIYLGHNDVIKLLVFLLEDVKFRNILRNRYPVIFIDEYQDTNKELVESLVRHFIEPAVGPLIGFFGDHWQKIYGSESVGSISAEPDKLRRIGKGANFRSDRLIVEVLNKMRPQLIQHVKDPDSTGEITVYHSNAWGGERRQGGHWAGDLPAYTAHDYLEGVKAELLGKGWDFSADKTKILMLTNNVLASELGYQQLIEAVPGDDLLKKNDDYVAFLANTVEPGAVAFTENKYGAMLNAFRLNAPSIKTQAEKEIWHREATRLIELRQTGSIGDVIDLLKGTKKPVLSRRVAEKEKKLADFMAIPDTEKSEDHKEYIARIQKIRNSPYVELIRACDYIDDKTLFSTKHGVKGAEFENVLVVLGRGWNHYNWSQFLDWVESGVPDGRTETFERNRNLFYVACSRPMKRLALLFTQELSGPALTTLTNWFGDTLNSFLPPT